MMYTSHDRRPGEFNKTMDLPDYFHTGSNEQTEVSTFLNGNIDIVILPLIDELLIALSTFIKKLNQQTACLLVLISADG